MPDLVERLRMMSGIVDQFSEWLAKCFGPRVGTIIDRRDERYGAYAPFVAASLAASAACFNDYVLDPQTRSLDPETATMTQLRDAIADCRRCISTEYPETDEGTYYAFGRRKELESALHSRFPLECEV